MKVPNVHWILKLAFITLFLLVVSAQKGKTPRPGTKLTKDSKFPGPDTHGQKNTTSRPGAHGQKKTVRPGAPGQGQKDSSHSRPGTESNSDPEGGLADDVKMDMIMGVQNMKDDNNLASLSGRAGFSRRKSLPSGNLFSGRSNDHLTCGETYPVHRNGHYFFDLAPRKQPCQYTFLGSRNEKCTVAILCNEKITLAPQSANGCDQEFVVLTDGTEGLMSGCGSFSFAGTPRIPRNNGTDIYMYIKGTSPSRCIAFCQQELGSGRPGLNLPKKITKNKNYEGFKMETGCMCGKRRDFGRVVGGETAFKFEFPWIGAIVFKQGQANRKPFCGGSLVSDRYFISAAHCFELSQPKVTPREIQVILHAHVMDKRVRGNPDDPQYKDIPGWDFDQETDQSEQSIRMDVQEIHSHPLFNGRTFDYDIAVLKFTRAVNLKKGRVAPICLPYMKENFVFEDETPLVVAGWGRPWEGAPAGSRALQKLDVPFMNLKDCDRYTVPSQRHICAGYTEGGKDACSGDSGGPLIYQFNKDNNQYLLAGVVSAGAGCARRNNLGLYSDVQEMLQWAYHRMPDALYCPREQTA